MAQKIRDLGTATGVLLDSVKDELRAEGSLESICFASVLSGNTVFGAAGQEECGGMLWVRMTTAYPSASFPTQVTQRNNCAFTLAYPLEVGILRPSPAVEVFAKDIELPDEGDQFAATQQFFNDMHALQRGILRFSRRVDESVLGAFTPIGPDDGVLGGTWSLTVGLQ